MEKTYTIWFKSGDKKVITANLFKLLYEELNNKFSKKIWLLDSDKQPIMLVDIDEIFFIDSNN